MRFFILVIVIALLAVALVAALTSRLAAPFLALPTALSLSRFTARRMALLKLLLRLLNMSGTQISLITALRG